MFLIDKPYVSEFFKKTVRDFNIPIVGNPPVEQIELLESTKIIDEKEALNYYKVGSNVKIYTTSENSIGWISKHLSFSDLPEKIELFKDKFKFRQLIKPLFPDFYFRKLHIKELSGINFNEIPLPFIIKPTTGFFSMGVYKVSNYQEWLESIDLINEEMKQVKDLYPVEVMDTSHFIIEQIINGEEFAVDAYFNASGDAVIVGIFKHVFSSGADVSDRVYVTSKQIIESNLLEFTDFINSIGRLARVKNFPLHIELRRDMDGSLLPIELNPMRFGGWCTTADVTFLAYGFNPYVYYYSELKPDWPELLKEKDGINFSIIVLDNSSGVTAGKILSFDYVKLYGKFEKPLELRKIDYQQYPVFGFLFTETREDNFGELNYILNSDLSEFITCQESGS